MRLKGTQRPYLITVQCAAVKDFNVFTAALPVTEQWTEVEIPFASLKQIGYGQPATWAAKDVTGLTIDARNTFGKPATFGEFELQIDWIRAYRDTPHVHGPRRARASLQDEPVLMLAAVRTSSTRSGSRSGRKRRAFGPRRATPAGRAPRCAAYRLLRNSTRSFLCTSVSCSLRTWS